MTDSDYLKLLETSIKKMDELNWQREQIDIEIAKLQQFIQATVNLLPDETTKKFQARLDEMNKESEMASAGLTDAIRTTLISSYPKWLTVTNVRDSLVANGFDFSSYRSNPLAAISTTLRRLAKGEEDVETADIDGVNAYRMPSKLAKFGDLLSTISGSPKVPADHPINKLRWSARKTFGQRIAEGNEVLEKHAKAMDDLTKRKK